eukprot:1289923-Prymnesium_polylepis.1
MSPHRICIPLWWIRSSQAERTPLPPRPLARRRSSWPCAMRMPWYTIESLTTRCVASHRAAPSDHCDTSRQVQVRPLLWLDARRARPLHRSRCEGRRAVAAGNCARGARGGASTHPLPPQASQAAAAATMTAMTQALARRPR